MGRLAPARSPVVSELPLMLLLCIALVIDAVATEVVGGESGGGLGRHGGVVVGGGGNGGDWYGYDGYKLEMSCRSMADGRFGGGKRDLC